MRCPFCNRSRDRVVDSREGKEGKVVRRRRECLHCRRRFTTYEKAETIPNTVIKKGGVRERFDPAKLKESLSKACEKRPLSAGRLDQLVAEVEHQFMESTDRELSSAQIGEYVMTQLKKMDQVAYIRFASVYLDFGDIREFLKEINQLLESG